MRTTSTWADTVSGGALAAYAATWPEIWRMDVISSGSPSLLLRQPLVRIAGGILLTSVVGYFLEKSLLPAPKEGRSSEGGIGFLKYPLIGLVGSVVARDVGEWFWAKNLGFGNTCLPIAVAATVAGLLVHTAFLGLETKKS